VRIFEIELERLYFRNSALTDYFLNEKDGDGKTITQHVLEMPVL